MTIIHVHHFNCNKFNHHYRAYALSSFYDDGEVKSSNPNLEMYDKKCHLCSSEDYTLLKDYEYNLEGAKEAIIENNQNRLKKNVIWTK